MFMLVRRTRGVCLSRLLKLDVNDYNGGKGIVSCAVWKDKNVFFWKNLSVTVTLKKNFFLGGYFKIVFSLF